MSKTAAAPAPKKAPPLTDNMFVLLTRVNAGKDPLAPAKVAAGTGSALGGARYAMKKLAERGLCRQVKAGVWAITAKGKDALKK